MPLKKVWENIALLHIKLRCMRAWLNEQDSRQQNNWSDTEIISCPFFFTWIMPLSVPRANLRPLSIHRTDAKHPSSAWRQIGSRFLLIVLSTIKALLFNPINKLEEVSLWFQSNKLNPKNGKFLSWTAGPGPFDISLQCKIGSKKATLKDWHWNFLMRVGLSHIWTQIWYSVQLFVQLLTVYISEKRKIQAFFHFSWQIPVIS